MLTGTPVFDGESVIKILQQHVVDAPRPPSQRLGRPVAAELEAILLKCLAKLPSDRPKSAGEILEALARCPAAWTQADAANWWRQHRPGQTPPTTQPETTDDSFAATQMLPAGAVKRP